MVEQIGIPVPDVLGENGVISLSTNISGQDYLGLLETVTKVNGIARSKLEVPVVSDEDESAMALEWLRNNCKVEDGRFEVDHNLLKPVEYRVFYVWGFNFLGGEGVEVAGQWLGKIRFYPDNEAKKLFPSMVQAEVE